MENYGYYTWETELYHHGTKGMKWGRRLYQNPDGSLTPLGKRRYGRNSEFKKEIDRQNALKKAREAKEAKKKAAEEEAKRAEERQKAVKSGNIDEIMKFKSELTAAEMKEAYDRIKWADDVNKLKPKDVNAGKTKADLFFDGVGKGVKYAETGLKAWNTIANVVNGINGEKVMPKFETDVSGNKKDNNNQNNNNNNNNNNNQNNGNNNNQNNGNNNHGNNQGKGKDKGKGTKDKPGDSGSDSQQTSSKSDKKSEKQAEKEAKKANKQAEKEAKKAAKEAEKNRDQDAEIIGEGTSKSKIKESDEKKPKSKPADYYEPINMAMSSVPTEYIENGRRYVDDLLAY